jgi:hypothetical protein
MSAPPGSQAFIYSSNLYVTSPTGLGSGCPPGTAWDTKNCHVGPIPSGRNAFVHQNKLYLEPVCDPPGPDKRLFITEVMLHGVKSGALDRDDVSWSAALYDNNNCIQQYVQKTSIAKVAKRDANSWVSISDQEITSYPTAYLRPNYTIALMLYDEDSCNCYQTFAYNLHCTGSLQGRSKSSSYGNMYLKYRDFLTKDAIIEFDIGGAQLRIKSQDVP